MDLEEAFGKALRGSRLTKGIPQEAFTPVSGRTYISVLERGKKSPTINKVDELASVIKIHPVTILAYCYMIKNKSNDIEEILSTLRKELSEIQSKFPD